MSTHQTILVNPKLASYVATRDRRVAKASGYSRAPLAEHLSKLLEGKIVRVGGRASCGGKVDPSWVEFTSWSEVVSKARKLGMEIEETPVKHDNAWATKAGGFWNENDYMLKTKTKGDAA